MAKAKRKRGGAGSCTKKEKKMTMKLLVDTKAQRVLYAEAGKDVVDFLFSLLALPLGTVAGLLGPGSMVGSFGNLHGSVNKLDDSYMCRDEAKAALLWPTGRKPLQLAPAPAESGDGFVQGVVTYTVRDDLKVAPMSTISGITLLKSFGIRDIGTLEERTVQLGYSKGLEILRASLRSKRVLTDVFLGKKKKRKAGAAFRREAVRRVVRGRSASAVPWRRAMLGLWPSSCQLHGPRTPIPCRICCSPAQIGLRF